MSADLDAVREAAQREREVTAAARAELAAAFMAAKEDGASLRQIAEAAGVSHQTVANILAGTQGRAGR